MVDSISSISARGNLEPVAEPRWYGPAPALESAVRGTHMLNLGHQGPAVSQLQVLLNRAGAQPALGIDALFGPLTDLAVRAFQLCNGLKVDGQAGPETLGALAQGASFEPPEATRRRSDAEASVRSVATPGAPLSGLPVPPPPPRSTGALQPTSPTGERTTDLENAVRALDTPVLNQHDSGSYPGGYCAITALRMTLRLEGKTDPGADAVAIEGAHPYSPGGGSSGSLLAARARELGLENARFTTTGSLDEIKGELARGHAVPIGGEGRFVGAYADGNRTVWDHTYGGSGHWMTVVGYDEARHSFIVNDPDRGARMLVAEADFTRFFAPDGANSAWMITY